MSGAGRRRGLLGPAIVAALGVALLASLGVWQLRRLAWKEALIAQMDARLAAPATALPPESEWGALAPDAYAFRPVVARGVYEPTGEALVFAGAQSVDKRPPQPGYFVMTPFRLSSGGVVLVDRGFLPIDMADAARRPPPPAGDVELRGWMRPPEGRNVFTPADEPARSRFYARDPHAIASALKLGEVAPFTIDAESEAGALARSGPGAERPPNNHLSYALTWFGLAATLAIFFLVWAFRR